MMNSCRLPSISHRLLKIKPLPTGRGSFFISMKKIALFYSEFKRLLSFCQPLKQSMVLRVNQIGKIAGNEPKQFFFSFRLLTDNPLGVKVCLTEF